MSNPPQSLLKKSLHLLSAGDRYPLFGLAVLMMVVSIVEVVGIISINPIIMVIASPQQFRDSRYLVWASEWMSRQSDASLALSVAVIGFSIFVFSNVLNFVTMISENLVLARLQKNLTLRFYEKILFQPYSYFVDRNSSDLGNLLLTEISIFVSGIIRPALDLGARLISGVFIVSLLVNISPRLALILIGVFGGIYLVFFRVMHTKQTEAGKKRHDAKAQMFRTIADSLGGARELKLIGLEHAFIQRHAGHAADYVNVNAWSQIRMNASKHFVEILAFLGLVIIIGYSTRQTEPISSALPLLTLYAVAMYRLLPALQQIFVSLNHLKFNRATIDLLAQEEQNLIRDLEIQSATQEKLLSGDVRLKIDKFTYPNSDRLILHDVDLKIKRHRCVGLVGKTGSGKTTIADLIACLFSGSGVELSVDGIVLDDPGSRAAWRNRIGYVSQTNFLLDETITKNIAFGVADAEIDLERVKAAAQAADLHDFISNELPQGYLTVIGERGVKLSGGQRQRIAIARALYRDPEIVIFDEATSALDNVTEQTVMSAIHHLIGKKTLLVIAHRLSTVQKCDELFLIENGTISETGSYDELMAKSTRFQAFVQARAQT